MSAELVQPDEKTLRSFLLGRLPVAEAEQVERFLESHPEAAHTLNALSGDDTLISALRQQPAEVAPDVQEVMDHVAQVLGKSETTTLDNIDDSRPEAAVHADDDDTEDGVAFLAPPQEPDELGRLGGYRILRVLGAGGMGMVLEADDPKLGRHVAIKVMRPRIASNAKARDRFLREARRPQRSSTIISSQFT